MRFHVLGVVSVLFAGFALPNAVFADLVVDWNLTDNAGNEASEAPNSSAPNITGLSITRGAGIATASASGALSSNGWDGSAPGSLSDEYFSLGFTVATGYLVDLQSLRIGTRSSSTRPGKIGLYCSGDSFGSALFTITQLANTFVNSSFDLSALTNLMGTVEFRLIEVGNTNASGSANTASTGTFRLTDYFLSGVEATNVQFAATVAVVPEPVAFLFGTLFCGVIGLGVGGRRLVAKLCDRG